MVAALKPSGMYDAITALETAPDPAKARSEGFYMEGYIAALGAVIKMLEVEDDGGIGLPGDRFHSEGEYLTNWKTCRANICAAVSRARQTLAEQHGVKWAP